jgi:protein-tyrosine kinase
MSEIFDFLKKTETERRKKPPVEKQAVEALVTESAEPVRHEFIPDRVVAAAVPIEVEVCETDKFDLTEASLQIKSVLDPLTIVGEQFRMLRSKLGLMQKQRGVKTILITSTVPQEGKTFTASGLVGVFAQEPGKRILLIDADLRKARSGSNFGLNISATNAGLSEVLRGNVKLQNALLTSMNPEFCFLPAGPFPSNPSELLSSPILEQALNAAAQSFDWIVIDSPPVLSLSDTSLLAPLCDAVVLVVRANSTPYKLVEDTINRIGRDRICGVVLNRQKQINSSRYYYQYYYSSSRRRKE